MACMTRRGRGRLHPSSAVLYHHEAEKNSRLLERVEWSNLLSAQTMPHSSISVEVEELQLWLETQAPCEKKEKKERKKKTVFASDVCLV
jgi:hypothetical protein